MIAVMDARYKDALMEIDDALMGRETAIVAREMEYAPFQFADEAKPGRLAKAEALVLAKRVHPVAAHPGTWLVQGKTTSYDIADRCSCKQGQHASSKWCYHAVAVELYRRVQARLGLPVPPWAGSLAAPAQPTPAATASVPLILSPDLAEEAPSSPVVASSLPDGSPEAVEAYCVTCGALVGLEQDVCPHCVPDALQAMPVTEELQPMPIETPTPTPTDTPTPTKTLTPTPTPTPTRTMALELTLPAARSIQAIVADLSKPLPAGCVAEKSLKGTKISFLHWQTVSRVLDTYAPGWSGAVVEIAQVGKACAITYRLTIPCAEGVVSREATGQEEEDLDEKSYGNSTSNSEAMAFKRAAAKFGLGAWLYTKDGTDEALSRHLKAERALLLGDLGKALDARQMPREPFIAWLRDKTGSTKNTDIPVVALKALVAQLGEGV